MREGERERERERFTVAGSLAHFCRSIVVLIATTAAIDEGLTGTSRAVVEVVPE